MSSSINQCAVHKQTAISQDERTQHFERDVAFDFNIIFYDKAAAAVQLNADAGAHGDIVADFDAGAVLDTQMQPSERVEVAPDLCAPIAPLLRGQAAGNEDMQRADTAAGKAEGANDHG